MNATHDPDRHLRAWLDLMPDEAPDRAIAAVLQATATAPQVRRPFGPAIRRFSLMNRLMYAGAAVVLIAVVAGGAWLFRPSINSGGPPTPSPSQSASPTTSPVSLAPESLRSTWLANTGPSASQGSPGALTRLVINAAGTTLSVFDAGVESFISRPVATQRPEFDLMSTDTAGGCRIGDLGRYGFAFGSDGTLPASDGTHLALTVISDVCSARAAMLGRDWVHGIDADSNGGRGIASVFNPMFLITLPAARYTATPASGELAVQSTTPDRVLYAVRDPIGFTDPCASNGGSHKPIAPTIAAFTAYIKAMPGFTVQSSNLTIDGRPAAHLTIPSAQTADCPTHRVFEWTSTDPAESGWFLPQGDTDVIYIVEVDGTVILFQWLGAGVTTEEEEALFATVHFTSTLPQ